MEKYLKKDRIILKIEWLLLSEYTPPTFISKASHAQQPLDFCEPSWEALISKDKRSKRM